MYVSSYACMCRGHYNLQKKENRNVLYENKSLWLLSLHMKYSYNFVYDLLDNMSLQLKQ